MSEIIHLRKLLQERSACEEPVAKRCLLAWYYYPKMGTGISMRQWYFNLYGGGHIGWDGFSHHVMRVGLGKLWNRNVYFMLLV